MEKSDLDDAKVVKEIANDHLVVYWNFKSERCAIIGGYEADCGVSLWYYSPNKKVLEQWMVIILMKK